MNLRPPTASISTLAMLVSRQAPELVELITENSAHPLAEKAMISGSQRVSGCQIFIGKLVDVRSIFGVFSEQL